MTDLTLATDISRNHPHAAGLEAWAETISTLSDGEHSIRIFYPGELVSAFETFDALSSGIVDMAYLSPRYYASAMPGAAAPVLPFQGEVGEPGSTNLYEALLSPLVAEDFAIYGFSVLAAAYDAPDILYSTSPVSGPSDLSGRKIWGFQSAGDAVDFSPVALPSAELVGALTAGVIDGASLPPGRLPGLADVAQWQLALPDKRGFEVGYQTLLINDIAVSSLPADLQALIGETTGRDLSLSLGETAQAIYQSELASLSENGTLSFASGSDVEAWRQVSAAVKATLIADTISAGTLNAQDWFDALAEGGQNPAALIDVPGTNGDDNLVGTSAAEIIRGLGGKDILIGGGGPDNLEGGLGNDLLIGEARGIYHTDISAQVFRMYSAVFGREPDLGGHQVWAQQLSSEAVTLDQMASGFVASPEFQQTYGDADNTQFVTLLYNNVLDRDPDAAGLNAWITNLANGMSRAEVVRRFAESAEHVIGTAADQQAFDETRDPTEWADDVYRLFRAVFDRDPDEGGFTGWVENLSSGRFTLDAVVSQFMASAEFQATYGAADNTEFVTLLYNNVLDRAPDTAGLNAWISNLDGGMPREEVVQRFMESPEFVIGTEADLRAYIAGFGADDMIDPGTGNGVVSGGLFADTFVFTHDAVASTVTVTDVEVYDTLQFTGFGQSAAQILGQMTQQGDDVVFDDGTETILFANTALADITESMISIA